MWDEQGKDALNGEGKGCPGWQRKEEQNGQGKDAQGKFLWDGQGKD